MTAVKDSMFFLRASLGNVVKIIQKMHCPLAFYQGPLLKRAFDFKFKKIPHTGDKASLDQCG